jgi:mannose-6-phosphate isomerase-like protein (cupin superfamily)
MPTKRKAIHLPPGGGRTYAMGPVSSVFKADGEETKSRYAISEWWLEPNTKGPGAHSHEDDDVFYVLEGTMSIRIGTRWVDAPKGSFVLVPGGMKHDFENRSRRRAGMLNVSAPGGFEEHMPGIAQWFRDRSPEDSRAK